MKKKTTKQVGNHRLLMKRASNQCLPTINQVCNMLLKADQNQKLKQILMKNQLHPNNLKVGERVSSILKSLPVKSPAKSFSISKSQSAVLRTLNTIESQQ